VARSRDHTRLRSRPYRDARDARGLAAFHPSDAALVRACGRKEVSEPLPISVVIPAYQAEAWVASAIASVRAQTRLPQEIIVVDDGSLDGTGEIARALGATVLSQSNRGLAAARNTGIVNAAQPWVALLDADDRWLPGKISAQWDAVSSSGDGICATDFAYVHRDGTRSAGSVASNRGYRAIRETLLAPDVVHLPREALARALPVGMFLLPSTLLFQRRIAIEDGELFAERLRSTDHYHIPEDLEWMLRALRRSDVTLVKRVLVEYAVLAGSLSSNAGRMRFGDAKLSELVEAESQRYVDGAAEQMRALRGSRLREASLAFVRQLEFGSAAVAAGEAFAHARRPLDAAIWMCAHAANVAPVRALAHRLRRRWRQAAERRREPVARRPKVPD
jgi:glycosyltransferase involved in cell wall biosynthesis